MKRWPFSLTLFAVCAFSVAELVNAQNSSQLVVYPKEGQSKEQQSRDTYDCHTWAIQQSGFDPATAQPPSQQSTQQAQAQQQQQQGGGEIARGALVGGAVGYAVNDSKGARRGAVVGGLVGGAKRKKRSAQQQQQAAQAQQQQQAATQANQKYEQQLQSYRHAQAACLEARGYSVK